MSGLLAGKVWQSALDAHLKPLAAALADIANDDGTSIYPSVAYVAWLLGRSERAVQIGLAELRGCKVLEFVKESRGGRYQTNEYRLIEAKLPTRASWRATRNGASVAGFPNRNGATNDMKRCNERHETVKPASPEPSYPLRTTDPKTRLTAKDLKTYADHGVSVRVAGVR